MGPSGPPSTPPLLLEPLAEELDAALPEPLAEELVAAPPAPLVDELVPDPLVLAVEELEPPAPFEEPDVPQPTMTTSTATSRASKLRMGISSGDCCCVAFTPRAPVYSEEGGAGARSRAGTEIAKTPRRR